MRPPIIAVLVHQRQYRSCHLDYLLIATGPHRCCILLLTATGGGSLGHTSCRTVFVSSEVNDQCRT
jgi:hypothetical protein